MRAAHFAMAQVDRLSNPEAIAGLKAANILLDRKSLSEIAIADPAAFDAVVTEVKAALKL